jgi:hypothetical protein
MRETSPKLIPKTKISGLYRTKNEASAYTGTWLRKQTGGYTTNSDINYAMKER